VLSIEERSRLVTVLLELDGMRERRYRDLYVELLSEQLPQPVSFARFEDQRHDVFSLVTACAAQTGALHMLAKIVGEMHPGNLSLGSLDGLLEELLPEPLLERDERLQMYQLVGRIRCEGVARLYREAVGQLGPSLRASARDLRGVVHELEDMNCPPDGVPPLVRFLEALARQVGGEPASSLRSWCDAVVARLRIPRQQVEALRSPSAAPVVDVAVGRDYAVVELQEDGIESDRFLVSIWLQHDSAPAEPVRRDDDAYRLEDIPNYVDIVLCSMFDAIGGGGRGGLVIEFVLPRRLLSHEVDQWTLRANRGFRRRLGIEFPVVVRSLERLRDASMHPHWRRKWAWLRANEKLPDVDGAVYWVRSVGRPAEALFAELLIDPKPVCLAFEEPPPIVQDLGNDELAVGLYAGTPVMIWCRGGRGSGRFRAEMSAQLAGRALFDLPEITLRLRREAVRLDQETDHLGLQITLLWDDPDRIPEPFAPLKAPA